MKIQPISTLMKMYYVTGGMPESVLMWTEAREYEDTLQWLVDVGLLRVRFSPDNLKLDNDVLNIPLFMADYAERLIGLALEKRKS